jgi:galactokinase
VVSENARVLKAVDAIRQRNLVQLGRLVDASHASLRDDFDVSTAEIDAMVEIARAERGVLGARITGGGFGGAIVILTREGVARQVAEEVARKARKELFVDAVALVPA